MNKEDKIYVAGHKGLVGSAIIRELEALNFHNWVGKTHNELDLTDSKQTEDFFEKEKPEYVFLAAAKVGGIVANNTYRADFIYQNLMIQNNVIYQSYKHGVKKLLFLGSTCIYPKFAHQPMSEDELLTGPLEYTNEPYAIAKIAGIKMCESYNIQYGTNFLSVMPTNLYGPNDNFDLETSHVLPALMRKMHLAKLLSENKKAEILHELSIANWEDAEEYLKKFGVSEDCVEIWGSGTPLREFLWSEDMAKACIHVMQQVEFEDVIPNKSEIRNTHINIGTGKEISIKDLAYLIKSTVGFEGELYFNTEKPDGTPRKLTDVSKIQRLGWQAETMIEQGVQKLYQAYLQAH